MICGLALLLLMTSAGGCAALPLAALGSLLGAAGSAASTGRDVYSLGKLDTAEMANLTETTQAAQLAAVDLGLKPHPEDEDKCKKKDPSIVKLPFVDDKKKCVEIRLEQRAPRLMLIRVDIGIFGSQATAKLILARLRAHLPTPDPPNPRSDDGKT